jgi:hypothetical protein
MLSFVHRPKGYSMIETRQEVSGGCGQGRLFEFSVGYPVVETTKEVSGMKCTLEKSADCNR